MEITSYKTIKNCDDFKCRTKIFITTEYIS